MIGVGWLLSQVQFFSFDQKCGKLELYVVLGEVEAFCVRFFLCFRCLFDTKGDRDSGISRQSQTSLE